MSNKAWGILFALFLVMFMPAGVSALAAYNGGQVTISEAVPDDVFASGGMIDVNAPVDSLIAAGGTINLNAPVKGDVIAAGGTINVNGDIGGKLVAAGGTINANNDVGTNAVLAGGTVTITQGASVGRDAMIAGGQVTNAGNIAGNLTVRARTFENTGTAGYVHVELSEPRGGFSRIFSIFGIIFTIGMLILGLVLLHLVPGHFMAVEDEVRRSAITKVVGGFFAIILSLIILVLISITIVLLPIALLLWMAFFAGLLLSTLFVSLALGRFLARHIKWEAPPWQMFLLGFIILNLASRIPVAGIIVLVISASLGFAAFFSTLYHNRNRILGKGGAE
ncbi:MAG: hemagglutinin repeat-containing protein [Methanoregulaceae archaeon]|nr:hemagglutinin repeat-containing protein [Methanoregulaceae archaeon]